MFELIEAKLKQENLLDLYNYFCRLDGEEKKRLANQINALDFSVLKKQRDLINNLEPLKQSSFESYKDYIFVEENDYFLEGLQGLKEGFMGCIIVAGGQASRLGLGNRPKGKFEVTLAKKKSLFQLFAEKTKSASKLANKPLLLAIMTSPLNEEETKAYFEENHYFGLSKDQVDFFSQSTLPFLDEEGSLFLESKCSLAVGPDGNGDALRNFYKLGLAEKWAKRGVKFVNFILIDNPLADPFDLNVLGAMIRYKADAIVKAVERKDAEEKVGVIVKDRDTIKIVEYTELLDSEKKALGKDCKFKHLLANISLFCFSMQFIEKIAFLKSDELPLHAVKKTVRKLDSEAFTAWKFERFIFDVLPFAEHLITLVYPRSKTFAPLKNLSGPDSIEAVQEALQLLDRKTYHHISGIDPGNKTFELAQDFYYPTEHIKMKWRGKLLPNDLYIEP